MNALDVACPESLLRLKEPGHASHVHLMRYHLKMIGVDAGPVPTEMIDFEARWNRPNEVLV